MPLISLRDYQVDLINRTRQSLQSGKRSALLVAPCGAGKTVMFSHFAQTVTSKGKRTLILAHRDELLDQISETLRLFGVRHSFIAAGRVYDSRCHVQIGSVFSVVRRLRGVHAPDIIIIDECHHAKATTWGKIFAAFPKAWRIGVTASPIRLSGESLGDIFDDLIVGPSVQELTKLGHLSPYRLYIPSTIDTESLHVRAGDFARNELAGAADRSTITGDAIKEYTKFAKGKRAIVFCVSVTHAQHVCEQFAAAGYRAMAIDGTMAADTRRAIIRRFRDGGLDILTSVDLISEGFDLPSIDCAIMLRPTASLGLWIQQSGRALRPYPSKEYAIILDHAGNTLRHGLPDDAREWSLEGRQAQPREASVKVRICSTCFGANLLSAVVCAYCKTPFPVKPRQVTHVAGDLIEADQDQLRLKLRWRKEQGRALNYQELVALGKQRGYKQAEKWAWFVLRSRQAKKLQNARN